MQPAQQQGSGNQNEALESLNSSLEAPATGMTPYANYGVPAAAAGQQPAVNAGNGLTDRLVQRSQLFRYNRSAFAITAFAVIALVLLAVGSLIFFGTRPSSKNQAINQVLQYPSQNLSVTPGVSYNQLLGTAGELQVNGQLSVKQSLTLSPSAAPNNPAAGQIYYDQSTNKPYYFDGSSFVSLGSGVTSIGGASGTITVGSGLQLSGGQLSLSSSGVSGLSGSGSSGQLGIFADSHTLTGSSSLPLAIQGNITQTGALSGGSITTGFGAISTNNNIVTTAAIQSGSLTTSGTLTVGSLGAAVSTTPVCLNASNQLSTCGGGGGGGGTGDFIENQFATTQTANFNIQSADAAQPVAVIRAATGQSAHLLDLRNSSGGVAAGFSSAGALFVAGNGPFNGSTVVSVYSGATTNVALAVRGAAGQTADLMQIQDSNGNILSGINAGGGYYTNGAASNFSALQIPTWVTAATGTSYYYEVAATNAAGETLPSDSLGMANNTSALQWTRTAGANGYKIYRNTVNDFSSGSLLLATVAGGAITSYTDTGSAPTTGVPQSGGTSSGSPLTVSNYHGGTAFKVSAYGTGTFNEGLQVNGSAICGNFIVDLCVTPGSSSAIGQLITAASGQTADLLQLQDSSSSVLSGFNANGALYTNGTANVLSALKTPTWITASSGTAYYYVITAVNSSGETLQSTSLGMANNTSTLQWVQSAGASGYKIYRNTTNDFTSGSLLLATVTTGSITSFTDTGTITGPGLPPSIVNINTLNILTSSGSSGFSVNSYGNINARGGMSLQGNIGNTACTGQRATLCVRTVGTALLAASQIIQGDTAQTVDLLQLQDSTGNILTRFGSAGGLTVGSSSSGNLIGNPSFETNTTGWTGNNSSFARIATAAYAGSASAQVTTSTTNSSGIWYGNLAVTPGSTYTASAYVIGVSIASSATVRATIEWRASDNSTISTSQGSSVTLTNGWQRVSVSATAPANTAYALVDIYTFSNTSGDVFDVDAAQFENGASLTPYSDTTRGQGSVTATQNLAVQGSGTIGGGLFVTNSGSGDLLTVLGSTSGTALRVTNSVTNEVRINSSLQIGSSSVPAGTSQTNFIVLSTAPVNQAAIVRGASGQTGDLLQLQDVNANVLSTFNASGQLGIGTSSPTASLDVESPGTAQNGTGTVSVSNTTSTVTGVGTTFTSQLHPGDTVTIAGTTRAIYSITSDTVLNTENGPWPSVQNNVSFTYARPAARLVSQTGQTGLVVQGGSSGGWIATFNTTSGQRIAGIQSGGTFYTVGNITAVSGLFNTGDSSTGSTSAAIFRSGSVVSGVGNTGAVTLQSGSAASGNSGNVVVDAGSATGGTSGQVLIGTTNASSVTIGRTATTNLLQGSTTVTGPAAGSGTALTVNTGADNNIGLVVKGNSASQSVDIFEVTSSAGTPILRVTNNGGVAATQRLVVGLQNLTGIPNASLYAKATLTNEPTEILQALTGQTGNLLELQDANGVVASHFDNSGQLTLGTIASSGTVYQGKLTLSDGTTDNFGVTLQSATLGGNATVTIPNTGGVADTVCLFTLNNCAVGGGGGGGTITGTGTANFVARWTTSTNLGIGTLVDNGTNVGINNASPSNPLAINSITTSNINTTTAQLLIGTNGINNAGITIQEVAGQATNTDVLQVQDSTGKALFGIRGTGDVVANGTGVFRTTDQTTGNNSIALMVRSGSTTSANSGNVTIMSGTATTSGNSGNIIVDAGGATGGIAGQIQIGTTSASALILGSANITDTIQGTASFTGNVGINTATPHAQLAVIGNGTTLAGTGTISQTINSMTITGTGTAFTTQLKIGDVITVAGNSYQVITITNDTTLTVAQAAAATYTNSAFTYSLPVERLTGTSTQTALVVQSAGALNMSPLLVLSATGSVLASIQNTGSFYAATTILSGSGTFGTGGTTSGGSTTGVNIASGAVSGGAGNSGGILISSGGANAGNSGSVTLVSGTAAGAGHTSGSLTVDTGAVSGGATAGTLNLGTTNASSVTLGSANIIDTIQGTASFTGKVGIGTSTPTADLDVESTGTALNGTGTVSVTTTSSTVTGTGTSFTTQLHSGDTIIIAGTARTINNINSDTSLSVESGFWPSNQTNVSFTYVLPAARFNSGTNQAALSVQGTSGTAWLAYFSVGNSRQFAVNKGGNAYANQFTSSNFSSAGGAGSSANVTLSTGNSTGGTSGNITIDSGTATGSTGSINIGTTNASGVTIGGASSALNITGTGTVAGTTIESFKVAGDSNARFTVSADGTLSWGDGTSSPNRSFGLGANGSNLVVNNAGLAVNGTSTLSQSTFSVSSKNTGAPSVILQEALGQASDILEFRNNSAAVLSGFDVNGQLYYQSDSFTGTVAQASLSQSQTVTIPASTVSNDEFCLLTLNNCNGGLTGGTNNFVARWTGTNTLGTGMLYDDGTHVGINNTSPANLLNLNTLTTADVTAQLAVSTGAVGNKGIVVEAVAGQTADLLQAQDSTGAVLASIDPTGKLTVKSAVVNGTLTVNGHVITGNASGTTTATVGAQAGASASVSVVGNDTAGTITITTGTGTSAGDLADILFAAAYASSPHIVIAADNANAASLQAYRSASTTGLSINVRIAPTVGQTYIFDYFVAQ